MNLTVFELLNQRYLIIISTFYCTTQNVHQRVNKLLYRTVGGLGDLRPQIGPAADRGNTIFWLACLSVFSMLILVYVNL